MGKFWLDLALSSNTFSNVSLFLFRIATRCTFFSSSCSCNFWIGDLNSEFWIFLSLKPLFNNAVYFWISAGSGVAAVTFLFMNSLMSIYMPWLLL